MVCRVSLILILAFLFGCSNESSIALKKDVYLETDSSGNGNRVSSLELYVGDTTTIYAVERNIDSREFISTVTATWTTSDTSTAELTTIGDTENGGIQLEAKQAGTIELRMDYEIFGKTISVQVSDLPGAPELTITTPEGTVFEEQSATIEGTCDSEFDVTLGGDIASEVTVECNSGSFSATVELTTGEGSKQVSASQTDEFDQSTERSVNVTLDTSVVALWAFDQLSDYIVSAIDQLYTEFADGVVSLLQLDQDIDSEDELESGEFLGTQLNTSGELTLIDSTDSIVPLDQLLPDRAGNLVIYSRFEGDYTDSTSNGNDGTGVGSHSIGTGKLGDGAFTISGIGNLTLGNDSSLQIEQDITVQAWIRTTVDAYSVVAGKYSSGAQGFLLATNSGGKVRFDGQDQNAFRSNGDSTSVINDGRWHHVVGQRDGSVWKLYVNGELEVINDVGDDSSIEETAVDLVLGQWMGSSQYNGSIDEFAIWNAALSAAEIRRIYQKQRYFADDKELNDLWTPHYEFLRLYSPFEGNYLSATNFSLSPTAQGAASLTTTSRIGKEAADLSNAGDHILLSGTSANIFKFGLGQDFSVSAWVKTGKATETPAIVSNESSADNIGFTLGFTGATGLPHFTVQNTCCDSAEGVTAINDDQWHHVVGVKSGDNAYIYVNGQLEDTMTGADVSIASAQDLFIGTDPLVDWDLEGLIDDVAIWMVALSSEEVEHIYQRQTSSHTGTYVSSVLDAGGDVGWDSLIPQVLQPYGKELSFAGAESGYSGVSHLDFNDGLISYWRFNNGAWSGSAGEVEEATGTGGDGVRVGDAQSVSSTLLKNAAQFDGTGDHLIIDHAAAYVLNAGDLSLSAWFKSDSAQNGTLFSKGTAAAGMFSVAVKSTDPYVEIYSQDPAAGGVSQTTAMSVDIHDGQWHHVLAVREAGAHRVYIDGELQADDTLTARDLSNTNSIYIGDREALDQPFTGEVDEMALWDRALDATAAKELYQRSANRVDYEIRSCADENCNCKEIASGGSADDCDGDSTVNLVDYDDVNRADWLGVSGSGSLYSELNNCATPDVNGDCTTPGASSPGFTFADFPAAGQPPDNRYFQFRITMSALDNSACSGERCDPKLTAVSVGPSDRYYAGHPVVESDQSIAYSSILSVTFEQGGTCTPHYQLSNDDGVTYYYYDGSAWVAASEVSSAQSSLATTIVDQITAFSDLGAGDLKVRALLISDSTQSCSIDEISLVLLE